MISNKEQNKSNYNIDYSSPKQVMEKLSETKDYKEKNSIVKIHNEELTKKIQAQVSKGVF